MNQKHLYCRNGPETESAVRLAGNVTNNRLINTILKMITAQRKLDLTRRCVSVFSDVSKQRWSCTNKCSQASLNSACLQMKQSSLVYSPMGLQCK